MTNKFLESNIHSLTPHSCLNLLYIPSIVNLSLLALNQLVPPLRLSIQTSHIRSNRVHCAIKSDPLLVHLAPLLHQLYAGIARPWQPDWSVMIALLLLMELDETHQRTQHCQI